MIPPPSFSIDEIEEKIENLKAGKPSSSQQFTGISSSITPLEILARNPFAFIALSSETNMVDCLNNDRSDNKKQVQSSDQFVYTTAHTNAILALRENHEVDFNFIVKFGKIAQLAEGYHPYRRLSVTLPTKASLVISVPTRNTETTTNTNENIDSGAVK